MNKLLKNVNYFNKILEKEVKDIAKDLVNQLEALDRTYFGKDRQKQLKAKLDEVLSVLDQKPVEFGIHYFLNLQFKIKKKRQNYYI